jgi:hypothetical protein
MRFPTKTYHITGAYGNQIHQIFLAYFQTPIVTLNHFAQRRVLAQFPHIPYQSYHAWVLFRFKTNLPLLPLPFSSSNPQSLLFSIQTEKKYTKSPPCDRASDSVAPKTLSAKALIKNGCQPNMYVYALFSIPTIDVIITFPSTATASSLLGTTPHY